MESRESSARIAVVDDEPRSLELLVRTLRRLGTIEPYGGAELAWTAIRAAPPDVVISDQRMPGMSGVQLLAKVAELDASIGRVLLTGYADIAATIDAINQGRVHAYINKPWSPDQLFVSIRTVLSNTQLERENARLLTQLVEKNQALEASLSSLRVAQGKLVEHERLAGIGRMIAMVVHDFRSPLAIVRSAVSELARDIALPPGEARDLAISASSEIERMVRMCNELLDSVRAGESTTEWDTVPFDVWLQEVFAPLAESAGASGVTLETQLESAGLVRVDSERMRRAFLNLLQNALEAMPEGGRLRIETHRDGDSICARIIDSGRGIPEEIRDRVFEPFVTAGKRGGSGLGLAIVKKVVDDHEGSISVAKADGGGTVFEVRLPRHFPNENA